MTMYQLRRRAIKLWTVARVPKRINRHNQRAWIASVLMLGDKWLLAKQVVRHDQLQRTL